MRRFASHGGMFVAGAIIGIAMGFYAAWRMGEPERLSFKQSQYFQVEVAAMTGEADALVERLCNIVAGLEKGMGKSLDVYVKAWGDDKLTALFDWKPRPSKAD